LKGKSSSSKAPSLPKISNKSDPQQEVADKQNRLFEKLNSAWGFQCFGIPRLGSPGWDENVAVHSMIDANVAAKPPIEDSLASKNAIYFKLISIAG
jgi:hypothetical protein